MPKEFCCIAREKLDWVEYSEPVLKQGQLRVKCTYGAAKHGTMLNFFKGHGNLRGRYDAETHMHIPGEGVAWDYPLPMGNMNVGQITEVGPGCTQYKKGDQIYFYAGFRPTAVVGENECWPLPAGISWKSAMCLDPVSFALSAIRDGQVRVGDRVAVWGMGAIGLMTIQVARAAGASAIFAMDPMEKRRQIALKCGANEAMDPVGNDIGAMLKYKTGKLGVDVAIDFSGAMEALQQAFRGVAFGGNVVFGAFPNPYKAGLDLGAEAHMNRPNVMFTRAESDPDRDHPRWNNRRNRDECHHLIVTGKIDGEKIVDPVIGYDELMDKYLDIVTDPATSVKLGVKY
jgi:threonine dehydrogenase-like Zn-dependent dehydrogenase